MEAGEAELEMAFAVQRHPGAYAMLIGAGVSKSSGVKSAWEVQDELIRQIAAVEGVMPADPATWYVDTFSQPPRYDQLLRKLGRTASERQALLRPFFVATDDERELGEKKPSAGHRAIARLVASERIRIIVTLNFDHLIETAIRDLGLSPTVVSSTEEFATLDPLHSQQALVIHLHGDYLRPVTLRNTPDELSVYDRSSRRLIKQIANEYGLIIAGWAAIWDPALIEILAANLNHSFSTWWIDVAPLSAEAAQLLANRNGAFIRSDSDTALGNLADAADAIEDTRARPPLTVSVAVASAKRALRGSQRAINLHDEYRSEVSLLRERGVVRLSDFNSQGGAGSIEARFRAFSEATAVVNALVATIAYWGDHETDLWWKSDIVEFTKHEVRSGNTTLIALQNYPATSMLYAAGVASVASRRLELTYDLLVNLTVQSAEYKVASAGASLAARQTLPGQHTSWLMFRELQSLFESELRLGAEGYADAWEWFEYLQLLQSNFELFPKADLTNLRPTVKQAWLESPHGTDSLSFSPSPVAQALRKELTKYSAPPFGVVHLRTRGYGLDYYPRVSSELRRDLLRLGAAHPLAVAGFCGGEIWDLATLISVLDERIHQLGKDAAYSTLPSGGGVVPSGTFWIDEMGKYAPSKGEGAP